MSYGFSTDWQIADSNLVVLDDDKHLFPPYYLVPVVRQDALAKNPKIAEVLNKVSPLLNNENMRDLNAGRRTRQEGTEGSCRRVPEGKGHLIGLRRSQPVSPII